MEPVAAQFPLHGIVMEAASWLRDYITAIKSGRLHPFSVVERKARAATRNEPWGPSGTMLAELAELSNDQEHCEVIFAVLEYRIRSPEHKWLCVYKALQVLEYLLQRGSLHCCNAAQEFVVPLAALQNFGYVGPDKKDHGKSVRLRAEAVKALILDAEELAKKRAQLAARAGCMKFSGYSREEAMAAAASKDVAGTSKVRSESPPNGPLTSAPMMGSLGNDAPGSRSTATPWDLALAVPAPEVVPVGPISPSTYRPPSLFLTASSTRIGQKSTTGPSLRNAGETKGVTFEQNKRQLEQLRQLIFHEDNRTCADCASTVAAARPTWASINLGVFICMRCAGIHRGLGVHISKVRSTTLDTWLPEQVATMARLGNRRANAHFEAALDPAMRPSRDNTPELERFIRLKYADKAWAAKEPWPPEKPDTPADAGAAQAPPSAGSAAKQPSGATRPSPSPPVPGNTVPDCGPALWASSWPPIVGSTGGGFSDSPPSWSSPSSSLTPPATSTIATPQPPEPCFSEQGPQGTMSRLGQGMENPHGESKGTPSTTVVRLLPPPPKPLGTATGGDFTIISTRGASPPVPNASAPPGSADLLRLDSETEDDEDDGEESAGSGDGKTKDSAAGAPCNGSAALWDLLDLNLDVMTWLERTEGAQPPPPPPPLPLPQLQPPQSQQQPQQQRREQFQKQPSLHQRLQSAPVSGVAFIATAAPTGAPPTKPVLTTQALYEIPGWGHPASIGSGSGMANYGAGGGVTGNGTSSLGMADSVITTAEFPVYDLLTPLPTGGGITPPPSSEPASSVTVQATGRLATGAATVRPITTPPASFSQAYLSHLQRGGPQSAPLPQMFGNSETRPPNIGATTATVTSSAMAYTPSTTAGFQPSNVVQPGSLPRNDTRTVVSMRPAAMQVASALQSSGPAMDLDNMLAMHLNTLDTSLAGAPNVNGGIRNTKPSWQPAAAVRTIKR